jgi:putative transposase
VGQVKGNSSYFVNHAVRPDYQFQWQKDFSVFSFGKSQIQRVIAYIANQKQHHAQKTTIPSLERVDTLKTVKKV